ncbi:S-layer homology domain-containing protein [Bacillus solitudinis]|uniref:S-layer homology domain-containing protein n=1 Tax=Bacillus solitudinis TaxID=2014074 RepID=UPI000C24DEAC|nr:S-layer homology domain-containing protein [Bacillus solitudinis]
MRKLKVAGMALLGVILLVGCSDAGASTADEVASAEWVDVQVKEVNSKAKAAEDRVMKLEADINALKGQPASSPFTDIKTDYFAIDEIIYLSERNVIRGYSDGTFRPNQTITRAQTASMLVRELKLTAPSDYELKATDVSKDHHTYEQLRVLEYHGLMSGRDGKMLPGDGLKRSQMAVLLTRAFNLSAADQTYTFTDIDSDYPNFAQINTIAHHRITTEAGKAFRPNETTTRAQFSLFLARTIHEPFRP